MRLTRRLVFFLSLLIVAMGSNRMFAQISAGGTPPSFAFESMATMSSGKQFVINPDFDVKQQIEQDRKEQSEAMGNLPLRLGRLLFPNEKEGGLDLIRDGEKTILPNGTEIWRLGIKSPGALAIGLYYDKFIIPEGGKLFIYNPNDKEKQLIGAYTERNSQKNRKFATELLLGDEVVLEYVAPLKSNSVRAIFKNSHLPQINISSIVYAYNHVVQNNSHLGESASCMVNINCSPEGDNWQDEKKGVAKIYYPIDQIYVSLCSGTIVNNTLQDLTPYYLTAFHCIDGDVAYDQIMFYFHFESTSCEWNGIAPTTTKTMVGAEQVAVNTIYGGSDGALLRLNQDIPLEYDVYYNGWDRENPTTAFSGVSIHHPSGDLKKISTFDAAVSNTSSVNWQGGGQTPAGAHWQLTFVSTPNGHGVTEGGSSGSPLFNASGLVVGTLSGGSSSCTNLSGNNLYGKVWHHWDQGGASQEPFAQYLDPAGTGQTTLQGTYTANTEPKAAFMASATDIYVFQSITYNDRSSLATTWKWEFEGGTPSSFEGKEPPVIAYNEPGVFETKLTINEGDAEEDVAIRTINVAEKGTNPVAPVANFALAENILLYEDFTGTTFPPTGWTVENRGASSEAWRVGLLADPTPDPVSPNRALYHRWDDDYMADNWFISPEITIPADGANLEFHCVGGGSYHQYALTYLYVIKEGVETEIWNNGHLATEPDYVWDSPIVDLSDYSGETIKLAWRYYGQEGDAAMIDGIKVKGVPNSNATISLFVGDYIDPVDLSVGPPILYKWEFEGGSPEVSESENPGRVRYLTPGTYDVSLWVKNYRGEDIRTLANAVIVSERPPKADFAIEGSGYIRQENYGRFMALGTSLDFIDKTANFPKEWSWTFDGAEPASSTDQNPTGVTYSTEGTFDLSFSAANTAGTDVISIPNFAKIGYVTDKVWNLELGEVGQTITPWDLYGFYSGYYTGTNDYDVSTYAERFDAPASGVVSISSVDILFDLIDAGSGGSLNVYVMSESGGYPGQVLQSTTLAISDINTSGYTTVTFPTPAIVDGAFYIAVEGFYTYDYDLAIKSEERGLDEKNTGYLFDEWFGEWYVHPEFGYPELSMNIVPEITYAYFDVIGETESLRKNVDATVGTIEVATNLAWTATSSASWVELDKTSGAGNDIISFTVLDNEYAVRRATITVVAGTLKKTFTVKQSGPSATDLIAEVTVVEDGIVELSWTAPEILTPGTSSDIIDDVEDHNSFEINSAGLYGWTGIDGDGQSTYGINGYDYPNVYGKFAYLIFAPSQTNPSLGASATYTPHSGSKYFSFWSSQAVKSDDWLISPVLSFTNTFNFDFWAKALTVQYGQEKFRIFYSTTGNAKANFTNEITSGEVGVSDAWTRFTYAIPAEAKYIAINYVSNDVFALFVDDVYIGEGTPPTAAPADHIEFDAAISSIGLERVKAPFSPSSREFDAKKIEHKESKLKSLKEAKVEKYNGLSFSNIPSTFSVATQASSNPDFDELRWDNGVNNDAIGLNSASPTAIEVAIRFTPSDLASFVNYQINEVEIFPYKVPQGNVLTVNVRQDNEIIYSQEVSSVIAEQFTTVVFTEPVQFDSSKDLYVGYSYVQIPDNYVAGCDAGPAVSGKGDLISLDGGATFDVLSQISTINVNWNIAVYVSPGVNPNEIDYLVYRDEELIGITEDVTYGDIVLTTDEYCYTVVARYGEKLESVATDTVCIQLDAAPVPAPASELTATTFIDKDDVILTWEASATAELIDITYNVYRGTDTEDVDEFVLIVGNTTELTYTDVVSEYTSYCYIVKAVNAVGTESEASNSACVEVIAPAIITSQPLAGGTCEGSDYLFSVEAIGVNLLYQWYFNDIAIAGATSRVLFLSRVTLEDAGLYKAVVTCPSRNFAVESDGVGFSVGTLSDLAFEGTPETFLISTSYPVSIVSETGGLVVIKSAVWSFSGDDVTFELGENSSDVIINVGPNATGGLLQVVVTDYCGGTYTVQQHFDVVLGLSKLTSVMRIAPNPVSTTLEISSEVAIGSVVVTDISGRVVYTQKGTNSLGTSVSISAASWSKGTYLVRIETKDGNIVEKIIKE